MSESGRDVMARYVGEENMQGGSSYLERLDPELHRYIVDFVFGEVYADDVLDPKTRALCTVAMLTAHNQPVQLGAWVRNARNTGATEEELRAVFRQAAVYAGFPSAWNALATMKAALEGVDESDQRETP